MQNPSPKFQLSSLQLAPMAGSRLEVVVDAAEPDRTLMAAMRATSTGFSDDTGEIVITTNRGELRGILTQVPGEPAVVVWLGGHIAGANGPAGLYADLARTLKSVGISSLRLNQRDRGSLQESVLDVLVSLAILHEAGLREVIIVGNQLGGAAAIAATALVPWVKAVAALGTKADTIDLVDRIAPRPLLLIHGGRDPEEAPLNSERLYERAGEPKELVRYPEAGFFFNEVETEIREKLGTWLAEQFGKGEEYRQRTAVRPNADEEVVRQIQAPDGRPVRIVLTRRSLVDVEADALVTPTGSWLDLRTSPLGRELVKHSGEDPYIELQAQAPLLLGQVGITEAGNLKARFVIHAVTAGESPNDYISNDALVFEATANTLTAAHQRQARSIGLPALGTGYRGTAPEKVAHIMLAVLVQHLRQPVALEEVIFSMMNETLFQTFADQIKLLPDRITPYNG